MFNINVQAKFFNRNENQSGYLEKKVFDAHCSQFSLTEKADGTCIQLWYLILKSDFFIFESIV